MMRKSVALLLILIFLVTLCIININPVSATSPNSWASKAPMQEARGGLGVAVVNRKIYAIGGSIASGTYPPDVFNGGFVGTNEEYDPTTDTWKTKVSMPTPRAHFAIAAYQNQRWHCNPFPMPSLLRQLRWPHQ